MTEEKNKQKNNEGETCEFNQKQAHMQMKKEDERKQIGKMMNKL